MNPKRFTLRHTITKLAKVKDNERILKAAKEIQILTYKGIPYKAKCGCLTQILQTRRERHDIFKVLKVRLPWWSSG